MKTTMFSVCLLLAALSAGCKDKMCAPGEPPAGWKDHRDLLPSNAVICDPSKMPGKPSPNPNAVHVYFQGQSPHEAWMQTVTALEGKGWERTFQGKETGDSENPPLLFLGDKNGNGLEVLINKTQDGTHGFFEYKPKK